MPQIQPRAATMASEIRPSTTSALAEDLARGSVVADSSSPSSAPTSSVTKPTSTAATSPTSTPNSGAGGSGGLTGGQKAAIAVPIIALLLIPLIYLLYRSHQYRIAVEKRQSQRSSQEAMLQRQSCVTKGPTSQAAALQQLGGLKSSPGSQKKPRNSLGLFNFDLVSPSPATPAASMPASPKSPGHLSIAHLMPVRRSQASVIHGKRPSTFHSDTDTRRSQPSMLLEPPLTNPGPPSPVNPHFAPLNQIGVACTRDPRPSLHRNRSSGSTMAGRVHHTDRPPFIGAYEDILSRRPSQDLLPPIPKGELDMGQFTNVDYLRSVRSSRRSTMARGSHVTTPHPPVPAVQTPQRYSDVSSLSHYDGDDHRRVSRQSSGISMGEDGGVQPHRLV